MKQEPFFFLPLADAALCLSCEAMFYPTGSRHCPACGDEHFAMVQKFIGSIRSETAGPRANGEPATNEKGVDVKNQTLQESESAVKGGTEWTEPGQGATVDELLTIAADGYYSKDSHIPHETYSRAAYHLEYLIDVSHDGPTRTNLRLTGEPLQAADIENIARAK